MPTFWKEIFRSSALSTSALSTSHRCCGNSRHFCMAPKAKAIIFFVISILKKNLIYTLFMASTMVQTPLLSCLFSLLSILSTLKGDFSEEAIITTNSIGAVQVLRCSEALLKVTKHVIHSDNSQSCLPHPQFSSQSQLLSPDIASLLSSAFLLHLCVYIYMCAGN